MESSDDSFVWTDASSNSEMALDVKPESGNPNKKKSKKRKLREDSEDGLNREKNYRKIKSEPESDIDVPKRKKKRQNESSISKDISDEVDNYLNIRVKQEQESFAESSETLSKKKKKHKKDHDLISNGFEEQHSLNEKETADYDNSIVENNDNVANEQIDNYFNFRIKQEQASFVEPTEIKVKNKKKSKKSLDTLDNDDMHSSESVNEKNDSELDFVNSVGKYEVNIKEERETYKKKKKKSKKKQKDHDVSEGNNYLNNDISEHEVSTNNFDDSEYNKSGMILNTRTDANNDISIDEDISDKASHNQTQNKTKNKIVRKRESKTSQSSNSDQEQTKQNKSISERLRFEDEDIVDTLVQDSQLANNWPKQIRNFVTLRKNITHVSFDTHNGNFVSEDDDIWIIKCPHEFDVEDFINVNLTLDNKCKIKLNGQTYDGALDDSIQRVPILAMAHNKNKFLVKNVPIKGITKFRKRIPKAHIPDQGVLPTNLNNFIPLPETKCRHPLLGADYKKAIKIPSATAERLNGHNASIQKSSLTDTCKPKKKKHKKEKCKIEKCENDYSYGTEVVVEETLVTSSKKKRKRKHSEEVDGTQPSSKRIKQDIDSADVWESEQAIENSLFG